MSRHPHAFLLLGLVLSLGACDTQERQDDFAAQASAPASGIVETDDGGRIISEDPDDWRTAPIYATVVRVDPAFPNPTSGARVLIRLSINPPNSVRGPFVLRGRDSSGRLTQPLDRLNDVNAGGLFVFDFSPLLLGQPGLHRLFIFDGAGEIVSYGDLLLE